MGILTTGAGLSFLLPSRMPGWIKVPQSLSWLAFGSVYLYISTADMLEVDKASIIRIILGFASLAIMISNISYFLIRRLQHRALVKIGIPQRRDEDIK